MTDSCNIKVSTALEYNNNPYEIFIFAGNKVIYHLGKIHVAQKDGHKTLEHGDIIVKNEDGSFHVIKNI